ncbi:hypothetical protein [Massilia endophytica]|uniref:hypothetical protein n=1 Tax=Massilia endophytica TaxID=2899220 RepID=UPI001E2AC0B4|nr:hypothetical protein [Massilia endophytica]UGQ48235.1 hypothetical protein LSQ66_07170 [Massilia endophytica]
MPASSATHPHSPASQGIVPHRHRFDADYAESALSSNTVADIAATLERALALVDDASNSIGASEERNAAYEAQAMRSRCR